MTEAGRKWIKQKTGEVTDFDIGESEFWIRAFCERVDLKAAKLAGVKGMPPGDEEVGIAFNEVITELLKENDE